MPPVVMWPVLVPLSCPTCNGGTNCPTSLLQPLHAPACRKRHTRGFLNMLYMYVCSMYRQAMIVACANQGKFCLALFCTIEVERHCLSFLHCTAAELLHKANLSDTF